jgi:hypothetical protein
VLKGTEAHERCCFAAAKRLGADWVILWRKVELEERVLW